MQTLAVTIGELQELGWNAGKLVLAAAIAIAAHTVALVILKRLSKSRFGVVGKALLTHCNRPVLFAMVNMAIWFALYLTTIEAGARAFIMHLLSLALIVVVAWLIIRVAAAVQDIVMSRYNLDVPDNLQARKMYTQLKVIRRAVGVVVIIVAIGSCLMTFPQIRALGMSILASAGIAGIILGLAAQRTLGTLIAGIQIALTQPIRIDDVVIVEGEWGRIEEITLTYVVVRIWDLRRLVVPISYFIEKPFQNWTRISADLLGTVFLYVDHTVPVAAVRSELERVVKESGMWDGKVVGLQVTDTSERTVHLRALMSAPDASAAWNLRCHVREKLIEFLQANYPSSLPRFRVESAPPDGSASGLLPGGRQGA